MSQKRLLEEGLVSITAMLLLAGCGNARFARTATSTLNPPATTPVPTATPPATSSVARPSPTPAKMPKGPGVEWHLVVISESSGWGLGKAYASQIEKDVGVKVTLDDFAIGDLSAGDVLDELQTGTSPVPELEGLPTALANADVVLLFPNPMRSLGNDAFLSIQKCFGNLVGPPIPCASEDFEKYASDLQAVQASKIWFSFHRLTNGLA